LLLGAISGGSQGMSGMQVGWDYFTAPPAHPSHCSSNCTMHHVAPDSTSQSPVSASGCPCHAMPQQHTVTPVGQVPIFP